MIKREWYRLAGAASELGDDCTEDDVLHLAATERLRLSHLIEPIAADLYRFDEPSHSLQLIARPEVRLHGQVGLTAYCAGCLEVRGHATMEYVYDLAHPSHEWWFRREPGAAARPQVRIRREEVIIRAIDLDAYQTGGPRMSASLRDQDAIPLAAEDEQAGWFDEVRIAQLETMFPAGGAWKRWAEHAKENGLHGARGKRRGTYNPYRAMLWFLKQGQPGWDQDRAYQAVANNLPPRSLDKKELLLIGQ